MTRTLIATAGAAALLLGSAGHTQTRTYRSPTVEAYGLDGRAAVLSEDEGALAGGPAGARTPQTWSIRSSHAPANAENGYGAPYASSYGPPIGVIVDVDADAYADSRKWRPRHRPGWSRRAPYRVPGLRGDRAGDDGWR